MNQKKPPATSGKLIKLKQYMLRTFMVRFCVQVGQVGWSVICWTGGVGCEGQ